MLTKLFDSIIVGCNNRKEFVFYKAKFKTIKKFIESYFLRNKEVMILTLGTVASQTIPFVLAPFLTRFYLPQDFAALEMLLRISGIVAILSTLRYEQGITLPKDDAKAWQLFVLAVFNSFMVSFLLLVFFLFLSEPIARAFDLGNYNWLYFVPLIAFFSGLSQASAAVLLRQKKYYQISISRFIDSGSNNFGKLFLGLVQGIGALGLIIPNFFAPAITGVYLLKNSGFKWSAANYSWSKLSSIAKEYKVFPKVNLPNSLIDVFQLAIFVFLVGYLFGNLYLGLYAFTFRILKTPTAVIGAAVSQVFLQKGAAHVNAGNSVYSVFKSFFWPLAIIGGLFFIPVFLFGDLLFAFIFGANWIEAGKIAAICSPWLWLAFIASGLSNIAIITNRQKAILKFASFNFVLQLILFFLANQFTWSFLFFITVLSSAESLYFVLVILYYFIIAKK